MNASAENQSLNDAKGFEMPREVVAIAAFAYHDPRSRPGGNPGMSSSYKEFARTYSTKKKTSKEKYEACFKAQALIFSFFSKEIEPIHIPTERMPSPIFILHLKYGGGMENGFKEVDLDA
jgi:hypothetical protein